MNPKVNFTDFKSRLNLGVSITAEVLNNIQAELANVVAEAGIAEDSQNNSQVNSAIKSLIENLGGAGLNTITLGGPTDLTEGEISYNLTEAITEGKDLVLVHLLDTRDIRVNATFTSNIKINHIIVPLSGVDDYGIVIYEFTNLGQKYVYTKDETVAYLDKQDSTIIKDSNGTDGSEWALATSETVNPKVFKETFDDNMFDFDGIIEDMNKNPFVPQLEYMEIASNHSGGDKWRGGCKSSVNGLIYFAPYTSSYIGIYNPKTHGLSYINLNDTTGGKFTSVVEANNKKIYFTPGSSSYIIVLDPIDNSIEKINLSIYGSAYWYSSIVSSYDGKIYCSPLDYTSILVIDPSDNTYDFIPITSGYPTIVETVEQRLCIIPHDGRYTRIYNIETEEWTVIDFGSADNYRWYDGCLGGDGKIYTTPGYANTMLVVDTTIGSESVSLIAGTGDLTYWKWMGSVFDGDDTIYFVPHNYDYAAKFTISTQTFEIIPSTYDTTDTNYIGCVFDTELDEIIFIPNGSNRIMRLDHSTETLLDYIYTSDVTSAKWRGGVLAPDGRIYTIPASSRFVCAIDPIKNTYELYDIGDTVASKWRGGCITAEGKMYCVPFNSSYVLVFDTRDFSFYKIETGVSATYKWDGGALAPNGKIYCAFANYGSFAIINTNDDTFSLDSGNDAETLKCRGAVLASNGMVYFIPNNTANVYYVDPETDNIYTMVVIDSTDAKFQSGALAPNGKIYCSSDTYVGYLFVIDPLTKTQSIIATGNSASGKWLGTVLAPDGKIYMAPHSASTIVVVDPRDHSIEYTDTGDSSGEKWGAVIIGSDGRVCCIPYNSTSVLYIKPEKIPEKIDKNILSPYWNHF